MFYFLSYKIRSKRPRTSVPFANSWDNMLYLYVLNDVQLPENSRLGVLSRNTLCFNDRKHIVWPILKILKPKLSVTKVITVKNNAKLASRKSIKPFYDWFIAAIVAFAICDRYFVSFCFILKSWIVLWCACVVVIMYIRWTIRIQRSEMITYHGDSSSCP